MRKFNTTIWVVCAFFCSLPLFNSSAQELKWVNQFGAMQLQESRDITVDGSGNVYTVGYFENTVDFDPGVGVFNLTAVGGRNLFVSKLNSDGEFIWALTSGGSGSNEATSIYIDANGDIFLTGYYQGTVDFDPGVGVSEFTSEGSYDVYVMKLNSSGDLIWVKTLGGTSVDTGNSIYADSEGVYVTGRFQGTMDFDPSTSTTFELTPSGLVDMFILKLDINGNFGWAKSFGATGANIGEAIVVDASHNIYTLARFNGVIDFDPSAAVSNLTAFGSTDAVILKLDNNGNFIWAKQMGGSSTEEPSEMVIDNGGNIYTTGYFSGTADFDPSASTVSLTSVGGFDAYATKMDLDGNLIWAKKVGSSKNVDSKSIDVDNSGNVYISGHYTQTLDADPLNNVVALPSYGLDDVFAAKLNSNGDLIWTTHFGGDQGDYGRGIAVNKVTAEIYVTGAFQSTADFDILPTVAQLVSFGDRDAFVLKLDNGILSSNQIDEVSNFSIFPNPALNELNIKSDHQIDNIQVYDLSGKQIKSWGFESTQSYYTIQIDFLDNGTYMLKTTSDSETKFSKFVKR